MTRNDNIQPSRKKQMMFDGRRRTTTKDNDADDVRRRTTTDDGYMTKKIFCHNISYDICICMYLYIYDIPDIIYIYHILQNNT